MIGHNLLEGKLVNLPKPLAVLHRPTLEKSSGEDEDELMGEGEGDQVKRAAEWNVVAVVKRKMVFAKRPMPLVGKIPVGPSGGKKAG